MIGKEIEEIAGFLGKKVLSGKRVRGFAVDSRKVLPGALFFALKGEKVDGHLFLREARERGAVCAVVDEGYKGESFGLDLIRVESVLRS